MKNKLLDYSGTKLEKYEKTKTQKVAYLAAPETKYQNG